MTRISFPSQTFIPVVARSIMTSLVIASLSLLPVTAWALPDLVVDLVAPDNVNAAEDVGESLALTVINRGDRVARGTRTSDNGYMVDVFITRDTMPSGFARFDEHYFDGVLLRGGRISNTDDLSPGQRTRYRTSAVLPADIPSGRYRLCTRVDPGNKIREADENNNTRCRSLTINPSASIIRALPQLEMILPEHQDQEFRVIEPGPNNRLPPAVTPESPVKTSGATHSILEDGSIVLTFPDGSQRRLRPDGLVDYVRPDGTIMSPMAIQVQGADLPALPETLNNWGSVLANNLLAILGNILTEAELEAFKQTEADKDYYERISWRLRSIQFLTAQETDE